MAALFQSGKNADSIIFHCMALQAPYADSQAPQLNASNGSTQYFSAGGQALLKPFLLRWHHSPLA